MSQETLMSILMPTIGVICALVMIARIVQRTGRSGWWCLLVFTGPPGILFGLWVLAYRRWPAIDLPAQSNAHAERPSDLFLR
jgi:hypothetical protein